MIIIKLKSITTLYVLNSTSYFFQLLFITLILQVEKWNMEFTCSIRTLLSYANLKLLSGTRQDENRGVQQISGHHMQGLNLIPCPFIYVSPSKIFFQPRFLEGWWIYV
jgi:hypothetical protein